MDVDDMSEIAVVGGLAGEVAVEKSQILWRSRLDDGIVAFVWDGSILSLRETQGGELLERLDRQVVFEGYLNPMSPTRWDYYALIEMQDGGMILFTEMESEDEECDLIAMDCGCVSFIEWAAQQDYQLCLVPGTFAKRVARNEAHKQIRRLIAQVESSYLELDDDASVTADEEAW
jgi:hypothetical protein